MAGKIKGITVEIGGETTKLGEALDSATAKSKSTTSELKEINKALKFDAGNITLLSQKTDTLREAIAATNDKLKTLKDAQSDVEKQFKDGTLGAEEYRAFNREIQTTENYLKNLEKQLNDSTEAEKKANSHVEALKNKYSEAKEKVKNFSDEHPRLAKELEATKKVAEKLTSAVGTTLKAGFAAGTAAVGAMAAGTVALGKAIFDSAEAASIYGDTVDKGSQKMGVSAEKYQQLAYAADLSGTSIDKLQLATVKLQKNGYTGNIDDAITELSKMESATERTKRAQELFGEKLANELAPLINQGSEAYKEAKDVASEYGLVMSDAAVKASAAFNDTKTTLIDTVGMIKTNLSAELMPGINEVMEGITGLFTGDEGAAKQIEDGINLIMNDLGEVTSKVVNILTRLIENIVEIAPEVISSLASGLTQNLDKLLEAAFSIIQTLIDGLFTEENITFITNGAASLLSKLVTFLSKNANVLISAASILITTLMESFLEGDNLQTLVNGCIGMIGEIVTALIDNAPKLLSAALEMAKELVKALVNYDWAELAMSIYYSIKDAIVGFFKGDDDDKKPGHAGGMGYVPYNGYRSVLHQGEAVLTAAQAAEYRESQKSRNDYDKISSRLDSIERKVDRDISINSPVNISYSGSGGALVRNLNKEITRENRRKTAFPTKRSEA